MTLPVRNEQEIKLAENLKTLMTNHGFTITATAKKIGMNKSTLHNYCNGIVPRNIIKIKELANLFDVSLSDLIFGKAESNTPESSKIEGRYEIIIKRMDCNVKNSTGR